jgi:cytochrome c biogenesis protein CcdA
VSFAAITLYVSSQRVFIIIIIIIIIIISWKIIKAGKKRNALRTLVGNPLEIPARRRQDNIKETLGKFLIMGG